MMTKTRKNRLLRCGTLAWRLTVFALTVGVVAGRKFLGLAGRSATNGDDGGAAVNWTDTDAMVSPEDAWVALGENKIGAADAAYYMDIFGDS